jgi:hypothetical protein
LPSDGQLNTTRLIFCGRLAASRAPAVSASRKVTLNPWMNTIVSRPASIS